MHTANAGPPTMSASPYTPPAGRQPRPRRKSLEQLEAKYKALMRNMLMYQQMKKRNMCREAGAGAGVGAGGEAGAGAAADIEHGGTDERSQQHSVYQAQQTLPTPSVSPASSTVNLEDGGTSRQSQHQHPHSTNHDHINPLPPLREQQRERQPQKRLQNANSGPKPAYDRRGSGPGARHARPPGRPIPAAIQFAYEELASIQQQQHQENPPTPIQHPASIQAPPSYLQNQYLPHIPPHFHPHALHQPLPTPLTTPPHLTTSYNPHQSLPALTTSYPPYDPNMLQPHQHQQHQHEQQQQQQQPNFDPKGSMLDCFVNNMTEM
ncbi:hypothetical protein F4861DRAFT_534804 [Xylaria intraflava]|nr:hypothetical protein F4861DRAFT_534804 [Xylaria intraflava]